MSELIPLYANAKRRIAELEAENAALREQVVICAAQGKDERAEPYSAIAQRHGFAPVPGGVRDRALRQFGQGGTPA